jgi:hypothetical protein
MVRMDFHHQHFRIPTIPVDTERGLRDSGRRASAFRPRELRQAELLGETDCTDDQMGEVHVRRESRSECDCAFFFTLGRRASVVTGFGRASYTNASRLTRKSRDLYLYRRKCEFHVREKASIEVDRVPRYGKVSVGHPEKPREGQDGVSDSSGSSV